mmetsp:Transcript_68911/g.222749  ORF Transcript_68911/g.222749 Transcript_68911/m.222749 type:complete len:288 (+) Transcript_68911:71-934(+)
MARLPGVLAGTFCLLNYEAVAAGVVDASAAVQAAVGVHREGTFELPKELNQSRFRILADLQSGRIAKDAKFDCEAHPHMCKPPFDCQDWTFQDSLNLMMHGLATEDGHANLRTWCLPGLERYADPLLKQCVANHDMKTAATALYKSTFEQYNDEMDASYCFAEGHCTNQIVSDQTTVDEMERMCDWRFGRKGWTMNFLKSLKRIFSMPTAVSNLMSRQTGVASQRLTRILTKMSCAQGVFHCDVQYCKRTYCRDEYYVAKYTHLLPPMPGHLIQDKDTGHLNPQDAQ